MELEPHPEARQDAVAPVAGAEKDLGGSVTVLVAVFCGRYFSLFSHSIAPLELKLGRVPVIFGGNPPTHIFVEPIIWCTSKKYARDEHMAHSWAISFTLWASLPWKPTFSHFLANLWFRGLFEKNERPRAAKCAR